MSTKSTRYYSTYIHVVVMFIIMIGVGSLPTFGQITDLGMKVLGVFLGTLYGWLFIDLLWPSLIGLVALGLTGFMTIGEAFANALASDIGIQVIITCIFAGALGKIGAVDVVSNWILTRKTLQRSPWLLILTIYLTIMIGTMLGAGLALIFMLWSLVLQAAERCGYSKKDSIVAFLLATIVILGFTSSNIMPFKGSALLYLSFYIPVAGAIDYVPFVVFALVYTFCLMGAFILAAKFLLKIDVSKFSLPDDEIKRIKEIKISHEQKIGCIIMFAYFIIMFSPAFLPSDWIITEFISTLGLLGITTVALMLLALVKKNDGHSVLKLSECHQSIPWDIVWLICATTPLANAMEAEESGIMTTIVSILTPILTSMSFTVLIIVVIVVLGILTQFTHNIVLGAMFIPFLTEIVLQTGGNSELLFMSILLILNCAYVTPAASMQAALIHGHDLIGKKSAYSWGLIALIASWFILTIIGIPLGNILW